jgi:uncharacterized protein YdeI (BOF family)
MLATRTRFVAALALAAGLGGAALGQTQPPAPAPAQTQTPIGSLATTQGVTIRGAVTDVFGNKFVVEDQSGRVLVETGPAWHSRVQMEVGETVTVTGEPDEGGFDAFTIQRANGETVTIREPGRRPPWAGGPDRGPGRDRDRDERRGAVDPAAVERVTAMLADAGFGAPRLEEADGRHLEFVAEAGPGVIVEIETYRDGRLRDVEADDEVADRAGLERLLPEGLRAQVAAQGVTVIEEAKFRDRHVEIEGRNASGAEIELRLAAEGYGLERRGDAGGAALPDEAGLRAAVEGAGYVWGGIADRKPRHVEVNATNPNGEAVVVHIDAAGEIYREVAVR